METATDKETVTLTIDGKSVNVPKGTVVADAAKTVDIEIPVFCYHEKLGPFGCCRMCLVEVEKMPKLATACTLFVGDGMVIKTQSDKVKKAQQGVLEFTLLNHPLDCPVCDKGGECPLQDNTFKYGPGDTRMEYSRQHRDKAVPLSPVITIDRERCIACQRCTRYSDIIEQETALVMANRGFWNRVSTFNDKPYDTRYSGNVIDICPVGALTNTVFRFSARAWELDNAKTLCGHCGCNCNITLGSRLNTLKRVTTRPNDFVDDGWICDKGRWGYEFTKSKNRITAPRKRGVDAALTTEEACAEIAGRIKDLIEQHGPNSIGFIGSPYGLNEELYLYQKLFRTRIGTNNIDHKIYRDTPGLPVPHCDLPDLETADLVLLIASDPEEELPILDLRLKKCVTRLGVKLAILNDQQTNLTRYAQPALTYHAGTEGKVLNALAGVLEGQSAPAGLEDATGVNPEQIVELAKLISEGGTVRVVYNPAALSGNGLDALMHLLAAIGRKTEMNCGALPAAPGTNAIGAMDMGVLPDFYPGGLGLDAADDIRARWGESVPLEPGLSALDMIEKARAGALKGLVVFRSNPIVDFPGGPQVSEALQKLDLLVVHDMLETETTRLAHFILPSGGPGYDEGTTTSIGGRVQLRTRGLMSENPPDWIIIQTLARELGDETQYRKVDAVIAEIAEKVDGYAEISKKTIRRSGQTRQARTTSPAPSGVTEGDTAPDGQFRLRVAHRLFGHDKILDAESPLAHQFQSSHVHMHEEDARKLNLHDGDVVALAANGAELKAEVRVSSRCNPGTVVVPRVSDEQEVMALVNPNQAVQWVQINK